MSTYWIEKQIRFHKNVAKSLKRGLRTAIEKWTIYYGANTVCDKLYLGGQARRTRGLLPPSLYVKRGPEEIVKLS